MAEQSSNPTLSRWELAARLKQLRQDAEVSVEDAAKELMCSPAKISRMENAGRGAQPRDIRDLSRLYGVDDTIRDELMRVATEAKKPGWWQDFRSLDEQSATYIGLEDAAVDVRVFDPTRLYGPLQTAAYTDALLRDLRTPGTLTESWIKETVDIRQKRRERVTSGALKVHAVLDEATLRRPVGGWPVTLEQIDQLLEDSARKNVVLQVVPFERGPYPGIEGSAQLLRFPRGRIDDVIYVEGLLGLFLLDKGPEVRRYLEIFTDIATRFALSTGDTASWLTTLRSELSAHQKPSGTRPAGRR